MSQPVRMFRAPYAGYATGTRNGIIRFPTTDPTPVRGAVEIEDCYANTKLLTPRPRPAELVHVIGSGGEAAVRETIAGRVPVIIGRGESNAGWHERYPAHGYFRIALNPFGRQPRCITTALGTPLVTQVEAWASFDYKWAECVPSEHFMRRVPLFCSPRLLDEAPIDGPAYVFDHAPIVPTFCESQSVLIAALAACGVSDVVLCGCDLAGDSQHVYIRRARLMGETDRLQFDHGIRVWMDRETKFPELAKVWRPGRGKPTRRRKATLAE